MPWAIFDPSKKHRYALGRTWDPSKPHVLYVMLNPSTADDKKDLYCLGTTKDGHPKHPVRLVKSTRFALYRERIR